MKLRLPDTSDDLLRGLSACLCLDFKKQEEAFKPVRVQSQCSKSDGRKFWIRMAIDLSDDRLHGHIHIDLDFEDDDEIEADTRTVKSAEFSSLIDRFAGQTGTLGLSAKYVVPLGDLGKRSLIKSMLGFATESCGAKLVLDGASMAIVGDTFTRLRWDYDEDDEAVTIWLYGFTEAAINPDYLHDAVSLMREGFNCFVTETGAKQHAENVSGPEVRKTANA